MMNRRISSTLCVCFTILTTALRCTEARTLSVVQNGKTDADNLVVVEPILVCPTSSSSPVFFQLFSNSNSSSNLSNSSSSSLICGGAYHHTNEERIPSASVFRQTVTWYTTSLETNPILTKSTTAAIMGACGDIFAQMVETWAEGMVFHFSGLHTRRIFAIAAEGMFISGPLMHLSYEQLERHFPVFADNEHDDDESESAYSSWFMVICQVLVDALLMDSVFVATVIVTSAILEGRRKDAFQDMKTSYVPAVKASWISSLCWSPVQLLSFKYVPLQFRVAAVNLQDIAWSATISYMAHRCRHHHDHQQHQ